MLLPRMSTTLSPFRDDFAVEEEPVLNVDYLSHAWREEDIWRTWRYVCRKKRALKNNTRLANALWRTWMKQQQRLGTAPPEIVRWAKDSDITWLYGPWKSIEPSSSAHAGTSQTTCKSPQLSSAANRLLRVRAYVSLIAGTRRVAQCTLNSPLVLEKDTVKAGRAKALLSGSLHSLSRDIAFAARYAIRWPPTLRTFFPSLGRRKVRFDPEVRQFMVADSACSHSASCDEERSHSMYPRFCYAPRARERSESPGSRPYDEVGPRRTVIELPSATIKSPDGLSEPSQAGAGDTDMEDDVFLL